MMSTNNSLGAAIGAETAFVASLSPEQRELMAAYESRMEGLAASQVGQMVDGIVAHFPGLEPAIRAIASVSLGDLVAGQARSVPYVLLQPLGFLLYLIAAVAEVNRAPFDLPETDTELVAGYHTEYSGMRFAMFYIAEYVNMITVSAVAATIFFGGWAFPILPGPWWLLIKVGIFLFLFVWIRATLPRLRYDQLMRLSWSVLLPLALLNVAVTAIVVALLG